MTVTWGDLTAARLPNPHGIGTGHVSHGASEVGTDRKPGPGEVAFICRRPPLQVLCPLGNGPAVPGGGVGGWQDVETPGREDGQEWGSTPNRTLAIPILLEGLADRRSVTSTFDALESLGRPPKGAKRGTPPPPLRLAGMVRHRGLEWVITGLDQEEAIWDGDQMTLIRWRGTVNLAAYRPLDLVEVGQKRKGATAPSRTYTVKRGDTLGSIAARELGANTPALVAAAVRAIKTLNNIRDPKSIKPGQKLKLPTVTDTAGPLKRLP